MIGRIHGDCYAGGVGLAAVCDVLVASEAATFCLSEARLGLLPGTISPYVVRALGEQASRRFFVTAERFSAVQAHALGFVHTLCAAEELDARVDELVASVVANGPMAVRACKSLVQDAGRATDRRRSAPPRPRAASPTSAPRPKVAKACRSFLNKRKPGWLLE